MSIDSPNPDRPPEGGPAEPLGSPAPMSTPASVAPAPPRAERLERRVESYFWLTRGDQILLAALASIVLLLSFAHWIQMSRWGTSPVEIDRQQRKAYDFKLDANSATWVEWTQLPGIGDSLAKRIVDDRDSNGPFDTIDDLARVKGIGKKTVERLRPWLRIAGVRHDRAERAAP